MALYRLVSGAGGRRAGALASGVGVLRPTGRGNRLAHPNSRDPLRPLDPGALSAGASALCGRVKSAGSFEPAGRILSHLGGSVTGRASQLIAALCRLSPFCLRRGPFHRGKGPKARRAAARTLESLAAVRDNPPAKLATRCAALHPLPHPEALGRAYARNAPGRAWRQKPQKACIMPPDGARKGKT